MSATEVLFVFVRSTLWDVYGGERSTMIMANGLSEHGIAPRFLVTVDDNLAKELRKKGWEVEVCPVKNPLLGLSTLPIRERLAQLGRMVKANVAVFRAARAQKAKIVHASEVPGLLCSVLGAKAAGAKSVYHIRDASMQKRLRAPEALSILAADASIAVSGSLKQLLVDTAPSWLKPILDKRVLVVHNGFELDEIDEGLRSETKEEAQKKLSWPGDGNVGVLTVAAVRPNKGQLRYIEKVLPELTKRAPNARFAIVGGDADPEYAAKCRSAVQSLGLSERVKLVGYVPHAEVLRWYRAADMLAMTSETEGLPRAAVEAQASGLPVVSAKIVGPVDVIVEGETGYLIDNDRIEEMVGPLARLIEDKALRERLGRVGSARAHRLFGVEQNVEGILGVYRGVGAMD